MKYIENSLLLTEIGDQLMSGKKVIIRAKGNSMRPFIKGGTDKLTLSECDTAAITRGKILMVKLGENFVVHRVVRIRGNRLILRGDANLNAGEKCCKSDVIAEVVATIRNDRTINPKSFRWIFYNLFWPDNSFLRRLLLRFIK